ncbi:hypothetical protein LJC40_01650 [Synergistaceae bacterium OttesenSCG-928-D05]|nr:hypothetical protein [Synergistaceae bacterium OttesenSCG-928-D05]
MPKDISSIRIARLNTLIRILMNGPVRKSEIFEKIQYTGQRTFERDIAYLRDEFRAGIVYDAKTRSYELADKGIFSLSFTEE